MFPRERGSSTPTHAVADPLCVRAEAKYLDESVTCETCAAVAAREQAQAAFNFRELGS